MSLSLQHSCGRALRPGRELRPEELTRDRRLRFDLLASGRHRLLRSRPRCRRRTLRGWLTGMETRAGQVVVHYVEHGTGRPWNGPDDRSRDAAQRRRRPRHAARRRRRGQRRDGVPPHRPLGGRVLRAGDGREAPGAGRRSLHLAGGVASHVVEVRSDHEPALLMPALRGAHRLRLASGSTAGFVRLALNHLPTLGHSPRSLSPGWSSGRRPCGQW
jgi:hypothetical protein